MYFRRLTTEVFSVLQNSRLTLFLFLKKFNVSVLFHVVTKKFSVAINIFFTLAIYFLELGERVVLHHIYNHSSKSIVVGEEKSAAGAGLLRLPERFIFDDDKCYASAYNGISKANTIVLRRKYGYRTDVIHQSTIFLHQIFKSIKVLCQFFFIIVL